MAEHQGHSWVQPCREYTFPDGVTVKGICAITSDEAVTLLRHYVAIEVAKPEPLKNRTEPAVVKYGNVPVGVANIEHTPQGVMIHGTFNSPEDQDMAIRTYLNAMRMFDPPHFSVQEVDNG